MEANQEREQWERIESYLSGQLQGEGLASFEQTIRQDETLARAVEKVRLSRMAVREYGLRNSLKNVHAQAMAERRNTAPVVPLWRWAARVAAGIAVVLISALAFRLGTVSTESLSDVRGNLYGEATRRPGNEESQVTQQLKLAYQQGDYQQCTAIYESARLGSQGGHLEEDLLAGNAYLALHLPEQAERCFRKILQTNQQTEEKLFEDDAEYYLGLALLQKGDVAAADAIFTDIHQQPNHTYHDQVSTLFYWQLKWLKFKNG